MVSFGRVLNIFLLEKLSFKNCEAKLSYRKRKTKLQDKILLKTITENVNIKLKLSY